jgi:hypothetical protein
MLFLLLIVNILFGIAWSIIHFQQFDWYGKNMVSVFMIIGVMDACWVLVIFICFIVIGLKNRWH